jgi:hypothetical protein
MCNNYIGPMESLEKCAKYLVHTLQVANGLSAGHLTRSSLMATKGLGNHELPGGAKEVTNTVRKIRGFLDLRSRIQLVLKNLVGNPKDMACFQNYSGNMPYAQVPTRFFHVSYLFPWTQV